MEIGKKLFVDVRPCTDGRTDATEFQYTRSSPGNDLIKTEMLRRNDAVIKSAESVLGLEWSL